MQNKSENSAMTVGRGWLIAGAGALFVVMPVLIRAANLPTDTRKVRYDRIAAMSKIQRERLQHNFETFQKLSKHERQQLRHLHKTLESDSKLRAVMEAYSGWLKTLSPWQREEIRQETDSDTKLELIRQFQAEQARRQATLGSDDITPVMRILEEHLRRLNPEFRNPTLPPQRIRPEVMQRMMKDERFRQLLMLDRLSNRMAMLVRNRWPIREVTRKMTDAISDELIREHLQSVNQIGRKWQELLRILVRGMDAEVRAEFESLKPSDDIVQAYFNQLNTKTRDEIYQLAPENAKLAIMVRYMQDHPESFSKERVERLSVKRQMIRNIQSRLSGRGGNLPRRQVDAIGRPNPKDRPRRSLPNQDRSKSIRP